MMVDVLFHENSGLLNSSKNKKAIESAKNYLQKFSKPHRVVRKRICAGLIVTAGVMFIYRFFPWDAFPHDPIWHILESTDSDEF
ncbi:hypothetical protein HF521_012287 [Silurus meridionalis]|uniref:Uncharacterized protein n=1 Tax=Silurus meridionalis TaxID=175797 RepID=A0A8T0AG88_SILME|nr:hypothetical protein HF521_012287 [Silurus meridionalis]